MNVLPDDRASASGTATPAGAAGVSRFERSFGAWVVLLTLLALVLRVYRLGAQSIWIDEAMTTAWIDEIQQRGWGSMLQNIHGPLHASVMVLVSRWSETEWVLRLPSALAGSLAVPAVALLGRSLWGARSALTAAALLAISPFALYYSQEVRGYAFSFLFSALAAWSCWRLWQAPGWGRAFWFLVAELAAVTSNLNGVFLAIGLNGFLLWRFVRSRRGWVPWLAVHLLVLLPLLPYSQQIQQQVRLERLFGLETDFGEKEPLRGATTLHPMALPYTAFAFSAGFSAGPTLAELRQSPRAAAAPQHWPLLGLVGLGFGLPFLLGLLRRDVQAARPMLLWAAVSVTAFVVWLAAMNMKPFNVRYLSVLLPFYLLFVARGLWRMPAKWRYLSMTAAVIVSLWSCANYFWEPRYGRDQVRPALQFVQENADPSDLVLHISLISPINYYDDLRPPLVRHARPGSGDSAAAAQSFVAEMRTLSPVIWYLECRPEGPDPQRHLLRALQAASREQAQWDFVGIRLYRFDLGRSTSLPHP